MGTPARRRSAVNAWLRVSGCGGNGPARLIGEEEGVAVHADLGHGGQLGLTVVQAAELGQGIGIDGDGTHAGSGLRTTHRDPTDVGHEGLVHAHRRALPVDVVPAESAPLTPPHAGGGNQSDKRPHPRIIVVVSGREESADLVRGGGADRGPESAMDHSGSSVSVIGLGRVLLLHLRASRHARWRTARIWRTEAWERPAGIIDGSGRTPGPGRVGRDHGRDTILVRRQPGQLSLGCSLGPAE